MKNYDCIVIGGGASGTISAINMAKNGLKVAVIDKNSLIAKKLLVTGNGKCNITNKNLSNEKYNQKIDGYIKKFGLNDTKSFFEKIGIEFYVDDENRAYPISNSAKSVVNALENQVEKLGIDFYKEHSFLSLEKQNGSFIVKTDKTEIQSKYVIVSCGSNQLTTLLDDMGIEYKDFVPSLVALKTKQSTKTLDGVRVSNVAVSLVQNNDKYEQKGEVLFKDHGISGICIFNLSSHLARNDNFNAKIFIDLLPNYNQESLIDKISKLKHEYFDIVKMMSCFVTEKVAKEIVVRLKLVYMSPKNLTEKQIISLACELKNLGFDTVGHYDNNQVFSGGVKLSALSMNLESNVQKNLFFAGEIIDVDGECGGYNLQWAWTSGMIASNKIIDMEKFNHKIK